MRSQPAAAAARVSNWVATVPSINWRRRSGVIGAAAGGLRGRAQLGADGCDGQTKRLDPIAEVGRHAQAHLLAEGLELQRERNQGLDVAPRSDGRQKDAHSGSPWLRALTR